MSRLGFLTGTAATLAAAGGRASAAAAVAFQLHGAYWSRREQIVPAVDPQVFVEDPNVTVGGIGLENIEHIAGLRALQLEEGRKPLFTADGVHLGFTSTKWLAASGTAEIVEDDAGSPLAIMRFRDLISFGVYSIFKQIPGATRTVNVPLDGTGKSSTFRASETGSALVRVRSPQALDDASTLRLIYHSDGRVHGLDPGPLGIVAHEQLVAPLAKS